MKGDVTIASTGFRPTVTYEVRTGLYFIDAVFWELLPEIYTEMDRAIAYYYPGLSTDQTWLRLASWIGGDRDGNPNVTKEITAKTLRLHRGLAVEKHRQNFQDLARRLSINSKRQPPSVGLLNWFENRRPLPEHVLFLEDRYSKEPYRLALALLADDFFQATLSQLGCVGRFQVLARRTLAENAVTTSAALEVELGRRCLLLRWHRWRVLGKSRFSSSTTAWLCICPFPDTLGHKTAGIGSYGNDLAAALSSAHSD